MLVRSGAIRLLAQRHERVLARLDDAGSPVAAGDLVLQEQQAVDDRLRARGQPGT